jgi:ParB family chromosome partitioning protein
MTTVRETLIPLDRIKANPENPREEVGDVTELAASIRELGLLQSLLVRPIGNDLYMLEAGERRWTAMRLGTTMTEAPCRILLPLEDMPEGQHSLLVGLVENTHREDLNPIERARGYQKLRDEYGMSVTDIAKAQGMTDATIGHYLTLMELSHKSQLEVIRGHVTVARAVKAVREHRAKQRKGAGQRPMGPIWEPDHFIASHALARKAASMCDARGHNNRRRLGKKYQYRGACGACWETVIRQDQDKVTQARLADELGPEVGAKIRFLAPVAAVDNNRA